jgi:hypothetical protein
MPASNAARIEKARDLPCDVVILDLEDAVAPDAKDEARASAVAAVRRGGFGGREVVMRVNGLDTPWGEADLRRRPQRARRRAGPEGLGAGDLAAVRAAGRAPADLGDDRDLRGDLPPGELGAESRRTRGRRLGDRLQRPGQGDAVSLTVGRDA